MIELPVHPAAAKACMRASAALAGDIDILLTATNNRNHQFWQTANPQIQAGFFKSGALILKNASTFILLMRCVAELYHTSFISKCTHSTCCPLNGNNVVMIKYSNYTLFTLCLCTIVPGKSVPVHLPQFYHLKPISCFCFCFCLTTSMFLSFQFDFLICNRKSMLSINIKVHNSSIFDKYQTQSA